QPVENHESSCSRSPCERGGSNLGTAPSQPDGNRLLSWRPFANATASRSGRSIPWRTRPVNEQALVSKVWNYAHVLRDEGVSYGDYLGQISFLLFLKMDEERSNALGEPSAIPADCRWDTIRSKSGEGLEKHYTEVLSTLSRRDDIGGTLFLKAESKIADPAKLERLVRLIDGET